MTGPEAKRAVAREGLVISHLGKSLAVENGSGETILCHTRRNIGTVAVGDRVLWEPADGRLGCVVEILERRSLLTRPARDEKTRPVAANLDQILIVLAPEPRCDLVLVDQYLVISENRGLQALLVCNKTDLPNQPKALDQALAFYRGIGYTTIRVSAKSGIGLDQLQRELKGHTSMLAGQSGVGKSSLTNALIPDRNLRTGELSRGTLHGKHTTTTTTLFHLPDGGDLIDSPGVAIFGLAETTENDLAFGYREFQPFLGRCRFNDCRHGDDRGCAISHAVQNAVISAERYERFLKLRDKLPP
ncbi:MAG: ribosome small subunit-dependent GTPase A [Methylococcaceae bacterium]|nr:ribosome small subunit-dependent GTPase A [Methylococcaceae bacterium]MCI0666848.1 ribosome small subunit-dependent GTPase A [Methylococcaceae bacterium]MCI0733947.1 ribosome small subunit-dependent GTPase A [Methylococcaceae bacterium]